MKRKLIEVALPLEAINRESAREKSIRHGHPSTLHLWWSRKPLAASRAVIFASLVDDPSAHPEQFATPELQEAERQRLFRLMEELVKWENTTNESVLEAARAEIRRSTGGDPPPLLDPFAGGGSIPLEAQRLGLEAHASDLNPVAVLINKALIEIPPRFADQPPVHPDALTGMGASGSWKGAAGLAEDIRRYGAWMRDEAERRIGHLYPKVTLPREQGGDEATVIAWLWARTVKCPNPACGAQMPLLNTLALSTRGEGASLAPSYDPGSNTVRFSVRSGGPGTSPKVGRGANFACLACGETTSDGYVRAMSRKTGLAAQLTAVVVESSAGRKYLDAPPTHESIAESARPVWQPEEPLADDPRNIWCYQYGLTRVCDLFTPRQLVALSTFTDLVTETRERVYADAERAGLSSSEPRDSAEGDGGARYADAVATFLAFAVDKAADRNTSLCTWETAMDRLRNTFGRQALPMVWGYAEANPFAGASGDLSGAISSVIEVVERWNGAAGGQAEQRDATEVPRSIYGALVVTDPPYYDNISYADLSDFFFVWLRRSLSGAYPAPFATLQTPKTAELVAAAHRFNGSRADAENHFESGLARTFRAIRSYAATAYPTTVFYAYRQQERSTDAGSVSVSTGWETMLSGLIAAGFRVHGTWPIRTELATKMTRLSNILASSVVLVCRPRPDDAGVTDRKAFLAELRQELPEALRLLQHGNIAPVDLAQASIGPGMAVFSRYAKVVEPAGEPMTVRTALGLINQVLGEVLTEQEDDFDADTRWAITWFEQHRYGEGKYGDAELLSKAKDTAVGGLVEAGIVESGASKVRLLRSEELNPDWDPATDRRTPIWEITQRLIHALKEGGGAEAAADIVRRTGGRAEVAKELAYRLYVTCERKQWADEARDFNSLVVEWPEITKLASGMGPGQTDLGLGG